MRMSPLRQAEPDSVLEIIHMGVSVQMKGFCEDKEACRHVQLLQYFGERLASGDCKDRCDNCLRKAGLKHDPDWPEQVGALCCETSKGLLAETLGMTYLHA